MKVIIDVLEKPTENDVLIYREGSWHTINKDVFFRKRDLDIQELAKELEDLKNKLHLVDEKLAEYHDILQIITKGE